MAMANLNCVISIVIISCIMNTNGYKTTTYITGMKPDKMVGTGYGDLVFNKEKLSIYYYIYYFSDGETLNIQCNMQFKDCRISKCETKYPGDWYEVTRLGEYQNIGKDYYTRQLQNKDHGKTLFCYYNDYHRATITSQVMFLFDPTRLLNPVSITMDGTFLKEKWNFVRVDNETSSDVIFYHYEYKFYSGESRKFNCKRLENDKEMTPVKIYVQTQLESSILTEYTSILHSWDDDMITLTCSTQVDSTSSYVVYTKFVWDPTDSKNSDSVTMYGLAKDRWIFIKETYEGYTKVYLFNYTFYDGEKSSLVCKNLKEYELDKVILGITKKSESTPSEVSHNLTIKWNLSYHKATLSCHYKTSWRTKVSIKTELHWNYAHPKTFKYKYVEIEGFDNNRLEAKSELRHYAVYQYIPEEKLNLTCIKPYNLSYAIPGYTKWIYNDNTLKNVSGNETSIKLQLKSGHNEQTLTCAYYLDDTMVDSQIVLLREYIYIHGNNTDYDFSDDKLNKIEAEQHEQKSENTTDGVKHYILWIYGTVTVIVILVAMGVIYTSKHYCKLVKARKRQERNYNKFSNETNSNQFPPNLENVYANDLQSPNVDSEIPVYTNVNNQEIKNRSLPYVGNNIGRTQLAPKPKEKQSLDASVQPKTPLKNSSLKNELDTTPISYTSLELNCTGDGRPFIKRIEPEYSEVIINDPGIEVKNATYENVDDTAEYVEPAYIEIIKKSK